MMEEVREDEDVVGDDGEFCNSVGGKDGELCERSRRWWFMDI
jgi:hypothetical protein